MADDQLQAQYTDLLLLNKHQLLSEPDMDTLHDHLSTLNEDTPRIKVSSEQPITPDLVFGLDTQLFSRQGEEGVDWEKIAGGSGWHGDEVETKTIWRGGSRPGKGKAAHVHDNGDGCNDCDNTPGDEEVTGEVAPISKETLEAALSKLSFEIYRGERDFTASREEKLISRSERHSAHSLANDDVTLRDTCAQLCFRPARAHTDA